MEPKEILALAALKKASEAGREAQKEVGVIHIWYDDDNGYDFNEEEFSKALACDEIILYENGGSDSDTDYIYQFVDITSDYHVSELHFSNGERDFYLSIDTDEEPGSKFRKSCRRSDSSISNQISNLRTAVNGKQDILDETSKITVKQITATEKVVTKKLETSGEAKIGGTMTTADVKIGYKKSLYKITSEDGKEKVKYLTENDLSSIDTNDLTVRGTFRANSASQLSGINNGGGDITNVKSITAEGTVRTGDLRINGNVKINDAIQLKQNNDTAELTYKDKTVDLMFVDDLAKNETNEYANVLSGKILTASSSVLPIYHASIQAETAAYVWHYKGHTYFDDGNSHYQYVNGAWHENDWIADPSSSGAAPRISAYYMAEINGDVYYIMNYEVWKLNPTTFVWEKVVWNNCPHGRHIATINGEAYSIYMSWNIYIDKFNPNNNTWEEYSWPSLNPVDEEEAEFVHSEGITGKNVITTEDGNVFIIGFSESSGYGYHKKLNKATNVWEDYNGPNEFDGASTFKYNNQTYGTYTWDSTIYMYKYNPDIQMFEDISQFKFTNTSGTIDVGFNGKTIFELDGKYYSTEILRWSDGREISDSYVYELEQERAKVGTKQIYLTPEDKEDFIEHTYAELKDLKDQNKLVPGKWYRITDFVTTCNNNLSAVDKSLEGNDSKAKSAGHPFDILVLATSTNEFSHTAEARLHSGDTYFADCRIEQWKIKYDFENDITKYNWAVTDGTGKGVIYGMTDNLNNTLPYDFKNIMFYRNKDLYDFGQVTDESGVAVHTMKDMMCAADGYYYTFSYFKNATSEQLDATVAKVCNNNANWAVNENVISDDVTNNAKTLLNNVFLGAQHVFSSGDNIWCTGNRLLSVYGNTFNINDFDYNTMSATNNVVIVGRNSQRNNFVNVYNCKFRMRTTDNKIIYAHDNDFYNQTYVNDFNNVYNNTFKNSCYINIFNAVYNNTFNNKCYANNFTTTYGNTFNGMIYSSIFVTVYNNTFGGNAMSLNLISFNTNTITGTFYGVNNVGQCNGNKFCNMQFVTISPICSYLNFGENANYNMTYVTIKNIRGASATSLLDLSGLMPLISRSSPSGTQKHYTIEGSENGKVLCYWLDDNGNKKGYYLDTTDNTWKDLPAATTPHLYTYYVTYDGNDDYRFKTVIVDSKDFNTKTSDGIIALLQQCYINSVDIPVTGYSVDPADMELISIQGISDSDTDRLYFSYYNTDDNTGPYRDYFVYDINQFMVDKVQLF